MFLLNFLILWPKRIAAYIEPIGPLIVRIIVGYTFMLTGWAKLQNLEAITQNFVEWGIPFPHFMTPFVAGLECFGGLFIILGLFTRICGGALAIIMVVAVISAKLSDIGSLEDLFGFEEATYFAIFTWLAICGAGKLSVDYIVEHKYRQ